MPFSDILKEEHRHLLEQERQLLWQLRDIVFEIHGPTESTNHLRDMIDGLDELFLLVVVGEFNSGKSTFINALLGERVLAEGPTPTTTDISCLKYGPHLSRKNQGHFAEITYPLPLLRHLNIVDTPGTNSIIRKHHQLTLDFIPRADLVLFVLSVDRPLTESERALLEIISQQWQRKVLFLLNKIDTLAPSELDPILSYLQQESERLFGFVPTIFPLSAREAFRAKSTQDSSLLEKSRFSALEDYIYHTLNETQRIQLKLLNPLRAAQRMAAASADHLRHHLAFLDQDLQKIDQVQQQLRQAEADLGESYGRYLLQIQNTFLHLRQQAHDFIDQTIRLNHLRSLTSPDRLQQMFNEQVVREASERVEQTLTEASDWLVRRSMQLWNDTLDYYHQNLQRPEYADRVVGQPPRTFPYDRDQLYDRIIRAARARLAEFDHAAESGKIRQRLRDACLELAATGVSAVGLGSLLVSLLPSLVWDFTGLLAAATVGALGFFILPRKRRQAKHQFDLSLTQLADNMAETTSQQFDTYIHQTVEEVQHQVISPLARFCRAEHDSLTAQQVRLADLQKALADLQQRASSDEGVYAEGRKN